MNDFETKYWGTLSLDLEGGQWGSAMKHFYCKGGGLYCGPKLGKVRILRNATISLLRTSDQVDLTCNCEV